MTVIRPFHGFKFGGFEDEYHLDITIERDPEILKVSEAHLKTPLIQDIDTVLLPQSKHRLTNPDLPRVMGAAPPLPL